MYLFTCCCAHVCVHAQIVITEINTEEFKAFSLNKDKQSSKTIYFYFMETHLEIKQNKVIIIGFFFTSDKT